jgi:hypothetical protein
MVQSPRPEEFPADEQRGYAARRQLIFPVSLVSLPLCGKKGRLSSIWHVPLRKHKDLVAQSVSTPEIESMWYRHTLIGASVLLVLALPLCGQEEKKNEKVTLAWKFEPGKTFYQTMTTKTEQTMKVMNSDVQQTQEQTFYFSWTPKEEKDGVWTITQKIEGVKMNINIGGSPISYDSTQKSQAQNALGEFFKALVGSEFTVHLDTKKMEVTQVEGGDDFIKKLGDARPEMKPLLEQILNEDALKEMAEPTFAVIPSEPKAVGDTWERKSSLNMGPIGKYDNTYTYTLEGAEGNDQKIAVKTELKYTPPDESKEGIGGLPFKIKSADLKSENAKGTILFDTVKGRVAKTDMQLELKGELSIEIGGTPTKVELSQTQTTTVETSDSNPIEKKS